MTTTILLKLDVRDPDLSKIRDIARAGREGKIIGFPTETVYGIGGPASLPALSETLARIKNRDAGKAFTYHIGSWDMVDMLRVRRTPVFRYLTHLFWPGPVTLLVSNLSDEKIGLRFPRNRLAAALIQAAGEPFLATSANKSGENSPHTAEDVMNQLGGQIDYLIDGGRTELVQDSTIVDITGQEPVIVRAGADGEAVNRAVEKIKAEKFPRKRILFVCTGNSCRSPMAAGYLAAEIRSKGLQDQIEVFSCGIGARNGASATTEAQLVMKNREVDISGHRSRACTREDILNADIVYAMANDHLIFITGFVPEARTKIKVFNIPDPIGMGMMIYEEVANNIEKKIKENWKDIIA